MNSTVGGTLITGLQQRTRSYLQVVSEPSEQVDDAFRDVHGAVRRLCCVPVADNFVAIRSQHWPQLSGHSEQLRGEPCLIAVAPQLSDARMRASTGWHEHCMPDLWCKDEPTYRVHKRIAGPLKGPQRRSHGPEIVHDEICWRLGGCGAIAAGAA